MDMIRNAVIAVLAIIVAALAYNSYKLSKDYDQEVELLNSARDTAAKDLQAVRDKLANEERSRIAAEQDAKAVSARLAQEQSAHEAAEKAAKASSERLTQIQNALANAEQAAHDARDALAKAQHEKEAAQ